MVRSYCVPILRVDMVFATIMSKQFFTCKTCSNFLTLYCISINPGPTEPKYTLSLQTV